MKIIINTDGGCRGNAKDGDASAAFVARTETGEYLGSRSKTLTGTNNIAEYNGVLLAIEALPALMTKAKALAEGAYELFPIEFRCDAQLIVRQMNGQYQAKDSDMALLSEECRTKLDGLDWPYTFTWVPRTENKEADYLCGLALAGQTKDDLDTILPGHTKKGKPTTGQLFQLHGKLATPRPMRADEEGYALCNGCNLRLMLCECPSLEPVIIPPDELEELGFDVPWDESNLQCG